MSDSTADQLVELQLLRRVDHDSDTSTHLVHSSSSSNVFGPRASTSRPTMLTVQEEDGLEEDDEEEKIVSKETSPVSKETSPTSHVSSFNALFARRLAGNSNIPESPVSSTSTPLVATIETTCAEVGPEEHSESDTYKVTSDRREKELKLDLNVLEVPEVVVDPAFEDMLEQLPHDSSVLTLSISDMSLRNLKRVRDALALGQQMQQKALDPPSTIEGMRAIRTLVAVDTLRLLLERYKQEKVAEALTNVVRQVFETYAQESAVEPLVVAPGVVTSRNIARIVLLVRQSLTQEQQKSLKQVSPQRKPPNLTITMPTRGPSPRGTRCKSLSPTKQSSFTSPSQRSQAVLSPRSILASEGMHLLIHEKIQAFQHRGKDAEKLPSFRVRRESAATTEEAARRRQRSIHYGYETTQAVLRHSQSASRLKTWS